MAIGNIFTPTVRRSILDVRICKGFCRVKKIEKSEKTSKVGGWAKPQLGFVFFSEMLCFLCCLCSDTCFKKCYGGGWVGSGQPEFFSDFLYIFFNLKKPVTVRGWTLNVRFYVIRLWVYGHWKYLYSYSAKIDFRRQNL